MKRQSYKIKHDFLFDGDDISIDVPKLDSAVSDKNELKLSDALKTKNEDSLMNLIDTSKNNVVIKDDIGDCVNPASDRYKQFIIRCVRRKLMNHNINVYL